MIDIGSQIWVTIFGLAALWSMNTDSPAWRARGVIFGLIGQPAWYVQLYLHDQWGMIPAYLGYTAAWIRGLWSYWVRPMLEIYESEARAMAHSRTGEP